MANQLTIELPRETPQAEVDAIQAELKRLPDVKGTGLYSPRGVAPADLMLWVKLAAAAVPMITQIVDMLRKRRIERATITLPNGVKLETDKATAEEIQRLMNTAGKTATQP